MLATKSDRSGALRALTPISIDLPPIRQARLEKRCPTGQRNTVTIVKAPNQVSSSDGSEVGLRFCLMIANVVSQPLQLPLFFPARRFATEALVCRLELLLEEQKRVA